jgi:hypothetical protein
VCFNRIARYWLKKAVHRPMLSATSADLPQAMILQMYQA